jgi:hypothetical protein
MSGSRYRPRPRRKGNRTALLGHQHALIDFITCEHHGKHAFYSRNDAREVAKRMRLKYPDAVTLEAYPCDVLLGGMWHVGSSGYRGDNNERIWNRRDEQ